MNTQQFRICKEKVQRRLEIRGALGGKIRTAELFNVEHLVVPVVALVEGVIWPMNAEFPELVLATELAESVHLWNGRPCVNDHPLEDGTPVSANLPHVFEAEMMGTIFNARMKGKKLAVEAWLNPGRAELIGQRATEILRRAKEHDDIEVSVGASVQLELKEGEYNGIKYFGIWRNIGSDHLAFLSKGSTGACSVEMGCGAPRNARRFHVLSGQQDTISIKETQMDEETPAASPAGDAPAPTTVVAPVVVAAGATPDQVTAAVIQALPAAVLGEPTQQRSFRDRLFSALGFKTAATFAGMTDQELRRAINEALFASEPAFMGIDSLFLDDGVVVYAVAPNNEWKWFKRKYSVDDSGAVTLGNTRKEVEPVTRFEPLESGEPKAAGCGCGNTPVGESQMKTKAERIQALIASTRNGFTAANQAALEGMSDEQIALLEASETALAAAETPAPAATAAVVPAPVAAAAAPVAAAAAPATTTSNDTAATTVQATAPAPVAAAPAPMTEAQFLAIAPPEIRDLVTRTRAADVARRTLLVGHLKVAQKEYTETELNGMPVDALERLARALGSTAAVPTPTVDYTVLGLPRAAAVEEVVAPPPSLFERLAASRKPS